jgi:hypothetical protein
VPAPPHGRPLEVLRLGGRVLVLLVTDCVSRAWSGAGLGGWLRAWSRRAAVGVVQVLPPRLWPRTALADAEAGQLRPLGPWPRGGALWQPDWPLERGGGPPVPVVPLTPAGLAGLAGFLAGRGRAEVRAYRTFAGPDPPEPGPAAEVPGEDIVHAFCKSASRQARRLASLLAAAPLINLPVIRLLGEATGLMPARCQPEHLAEVWLGGLLQAVEEENAEDPDRVVYNFRPGVRDSLLDGLAWSDTWQVLDQVSEYLEQNLGRLRGLRGYLQNPQEKLGLFDGRDRLFALVAAQVLRRLGGEYAVLAGQIEEQLEETPVRFGVWLRGLCDLAKEWAMDSRDPHHDKAQTYSYVELIFAFGLARLGEGTPAGRCSTVPRRCSARRTAPTSSCCGPMSTASSRPSTASRTPVRCRASTLSTWRRWICGCATWPPGCASTPKSWSPTIASTRTDRSGRPKLIMSCKPW